MNPISDTAAVIGGTQTLSSSGQERLMKDKLMTSVVHLRDVEVPEFVLPKQGFIRPLQLLPPRGPLPISKSTLYSWVADGVLPPLVPIGKGRIRGFRVEEIREFLADPNRRAT